MTRRTGSAATSTSGLLDADSVVPYLTRRGLLEAVTPAVVRELDGGVSNIVLAVEAGEASWVVKQSLPRLRVEAEWLAKQERTLNEARGLRVAAALTPGHVPEVVDVDPERFVLVIERAPVGLTSWKALLIAGTVDNAVASTLGRLLGTWHVATAADPGSTDGLDDPEAFEQLRVGPYHRAAAAAVPDMKEQILEVVRAMAARRICLVHGDFSPKNVLAGPAGTWVLDFEVAHRGDPDFDVAFLLSHLLLKAVHRPEHSVALETAAGAFLTTYDATTADVPWRADSGHLVAHLGALLLARSDGKSPAEYLTPHARAVVRATGRRLLGERPGLSEIWTICHQELSS